jgi:hypothetical protein
MSRSPRHRLGEDPALAELVRGINERHGTSFTFEGRFAAGESGAARVRDARGLRYVVKRADSRRAARTTRALCPLGYPVPRYVIVESDYSVQTELLGKPLAAKRDLPRAVLRRLIELNELQATRALEPAPDWPAPITVPILSGGPPSIDLELIQKHSRAAARLIAWCQGVVAGGGESLPPAEDVSHWDFAPANVLVEGDAVTGVIDWEQTRSGDRLFDLAVLLFHSGERPLRRYLVNRIGEETVAVYTAHACIRSLGWAVSANPPGRAAGYVRLAWRALEAAGFSLRPRQPGARARS